jgi:hypothetical protein
MKTLLASLIAALSFHTAGHADVMYEWQGNEDATPYNIAMRMVFTDGAVASGSASVTGYGALPPDSPLLLFYYQMPNAASPVSFAPSPVPVWSDNVFSMNVTFLADGTLSGSLYANDTASHIRLASSGNLFTVVSANSDAGMTGAGCAPGSNCAGATGTFRRVGTAAPEAVAEVPEPGSLALFGLGLLAAARVGRRSRKA